MAWTTLQQYVEGPRLDASVAVERLWQGITSIASRGERVCVACPRLFRLQNIKPF